MPKVIADHDAIVEDKDDSSYVFVQGETHLHCKTCAQEVEMLQCKCGKFGPRSYIEAHLADRKAKGTPAALATHRLVETTVPPLVVSARKEAEQYEVVEGARKRTRKD